jgi:hypothetical protein
VGVRHDKDNPYIPAKAQGPAALRGIAMSVTDIRSAIPMRPSIRRFLLMLALLAVPALAAAGCGDDSSSKTTAAAGLTADQWRQQADAICADIDTRQNAITEPASSANVQTYLEAILPLGKEQVTRLQALVPPAELQSLQSQAVANQQEAVSVVEQAIARIKGGEDPATVITELTADVNRITAKGKDLARQAGLTECGSGEGDGTTSTDTTTESTDATSTPTIPTTGDAQVDRFLADVQKATGALTAFGTALSAASNPDDIKDKAGELRGQLEDFDTAIAAMDEYTLDNATVEGQRSRLVATGPGVSDVLRRFIDAAGSGDIATIGTILPEVATALQDFTKAAQPQ